MPLIQSLFTLFYGVINNILQHAGYLPLLITAAFIAAVVFDSIHVFTGGKI